MKGFKQFILRGNVVDLAVGVVIGASFGAVVMDRLLSKKAVREVVGFSFAHIARMEEAGTFPQRIRIGGRVFWLLSEVSDWVQSHVAARNASRIS